MSGGHFDYYQYHINEIADKIEQAIHKNDGCEYPYSPEVIAKFKEALPYLQRAFVYAHRIDWLLSCDDGEESFFSRLHEDMARVAAEFDQPDDTQRLQWLADNMQMNFGKRDRAQWLMENMPLVVESDREACQLDDLRKAIDEAMNENPRL